MPNEAIERALAAYRTTIRFVPAPADDGVGDVLKSNSPDAMRAAISAYFADAPVSEGMRRSGVDCIRHFDLGPVLAERVFKAMCRQHAEELSNGR